MYNKPFPVFDPSNIEHCRLLDALVDLLYEEGEADSWSGRRTKYPTEPMLGYHEIKDIEDSLKRCGMDPAKAGRTYLSRCFNHLRWDLGSQLGCGDPEYIELVCDIQKYVLSNAWYCSRKFIRFYDAYMAVAPAHPVLDYLHSFIYPVYLETHKSPNRGEAA